MTEVDPGFLRFGHKAMPGECFKNRAQIGHEFVIINMIRRQRVGARPHVARKCPAIHDKRIGKGCGFGFPEITVPQKSIALRRRAFARIAGTETRTVSAANPVAGLREIIRQTGVPDHGNFAGRPQDPFGFRPETVFIQPVKRLGNRDEIHRMIRQAGRFAGSGQAGDRREQELEFRSHISIRLNRRHLTEMPRQKPGENAGPGSDIDNSIACDPGFQPDRGRIGVGRAELRIIL